MKKSFIIIALLILVVVSFFVFKNNSSVKNNAADKNSDAITVITIGASRFQYSPDVIKVKKGEHTKIVIDNKDTTHGITIPGLGVGGINSVEFTADKTGTYEFHCPIFCGQGHKEMKGTLIVE